MPPVQIPPLKDTGLMSGLIDEFDGMLRDDGLDACGQTYHGSALDSDGYFFGLCRRPGVVLSYLKHSLAGAVVSEGETVTVVT